MILSLKEKMKELFGDQEYCEECDSMTDVLSEKYDFIEVGTYFITADIHCCAECGAVMQDKSKLKRSE